jgi:predicted dehydrogenase
MQIAIVGSGFVADFYARHIRSHPALRLAGVSDRDPNRASRFGEFHSLPVYRSFDELLEDDSIDIVVNLTNPRSHFQVSKACLEADKHVYSEKPLAMQLSEARELVDLAAGRGLYISSAPSTVLGETAQTIWKALREDTIGRVRLIYAELDDGLVHRKPYRALRGRVRSRMHGRARRLLRHLAHRILRSGAEGHGVFVVLGSRQADRHPSRGQCS